MDRIAARLVGRAEPDHRLHRDQRRLARLSPGRRDGRVKRLAVVAVAPLDVPAAGLEARGHILGEADRGRAVDGDVVVVIQHDQLAQAQMARKADGFLPDAFLQAAVAGEDIGVMIDQIVTELCRQPPFRQCHAHRRGQTLAQRAGRRLDPLGMAVFRVARRDGSPLAEVPDLLQRHVLIARQVQQGIEQHGRVAVRQHEAVAIRPVGVLGVELQVVAEQHRGRVGHAHGGARMARIRRVHRVDGQRADAVGQREVLRIQIGLGRDLGVFGRI